jgi:hypothetical protein
MCSHAPSCPNSSATDAAAARVIADHTEQGWSLLCNRVILFTDGEMLRPTLDRPQQCRAIARQGKQKVSTRCAFGRSAGRRR